MKKLFLLLFLAINGMAAYAQATGRSALEEAVRKYFSAYQAAGYKPADAMRADSLRIDENARTLTVFANEPFTSQTFTPETVRRIYKELSLRLPQPYNTYRITICGKGGKTIEELIPNILREDGTDRTKLWGDVAYKGDPWVRNMSLPYGITRGLQGRHLFIAASHGRYYRSGGWHWQRPNLYCTTEDLFTQSFVYPFLIPMLEKAGAVVYSPRERDTQTAEAIVDNDAPGEGGIYEEKEQPEFPWQTVAGTAGFGRPQTGAFTDSVAPFRLGTARYATATPRSSRLSTAVWTPHIPQDGKYAVYVSYASLPNSVSDAHYTVFHKGGRTQFRVNQQMGGGTWVYLGTFEFEAGADRGGRVTLSNQSSYRGVVTADGVRFGGGMGQTLRGDAGTSQLPRFLEGARYQAQWCGMPDSLYRRDDTNDYNDDIRSRPFLLNYLAGGSCFLPADGGCKVPFEVSVAVHSDAGVRPDNGIYGTLAICTTQDAEGNRDYPAGLARAASSDLASLLLTSVTEDLARTFRSDWTRRELWDRNYGETRIGNVPSAILEMLSHQNFTDLKYGHDPTFKFAMARAIYKALLRFVNFEHGIKDFDVQPLPIHRFAALLSPDGKSVRLSWQPTTDSLEASARPTGYVLYTKTDGGGFDNGQMLDSRTSITLPITEGRQYSYMVTAVNRGGESFPSETLSVYKAPNERGRVLIVNGFERLSGPAWIETADSAGFDLRSDIGVPYLYTAAFAGEQRCFAPGTTGQKNGSTPGACGNELAGSVIAGNTFDYPVLHGQAIAQSGEYSFASCSKEAFADPATALADYQAIDYIAGLERDVPHNLHPYKSFPPEVRNKLTAYLQSGGSLLASGAYLGSDMRSSEERAFTENVLKYRYAGTDTLCRTDLRQETPDSIAGLNLRIPVQRSFSPLRYAAPATDILLPACDTAFPAFAYSSGRSAGIAYPGSDYRVIATGFPFECITDVQTRQQAMLAILRFLIK